MLLDAINKHFGPYREKYAYYQDHKDEVYRILEEGGNKARARAQVTMKDVREKVGLSKKV